MNMYLQLIVELSIPLIQEHSGQSKQLKMHGYMVGETFLAWLSDFC